MRIFGADRITGLMERLGMEEDVPIEAPLVNRAIENAQQKVEAMHFDTRKNLFEYDNVMNEQRKAIYALRKQILEGRYRPEILDERGAQGAAAQAAAAAGEVGAAHHRVAVEDHPRTGEVASSTGTAPGSSPPAAEPSPERRGASRARASSRRG